MGYYHKMNVARNNGVEMERILLVEPPRWKGWPVRRADRCERPAIYNGIPFPYCLASTTSYLREKGVSVDFFDANALNGTWNDIENCIKNSKPNIVLFSSANCTIDYDLKVAEITKKINDDIITAIIEPILAPRRPQEIFSQCPSLDVIFNGEPENIAFSLCKDELDAEGIIIKDDDEVVSIPSKQFDISNLSMPAYDLLPLRKYQGITVRFSRGCPSNCIFCTLGSQSESSAFNKRLRFRGIKKVIEELEYLCSIGIKKISFGDEVLTINKKKIMDLCEEIIERKLNIKFECETRLDCIDKEILEILKQAGCTQIGYGIESGDDKILAQIKKNMTVSKIKEGFRLTKETGILTAAFNIIGLPGETKETAQKTIELNKEIKPDTVQFATATPVIGTEFWDFCVNNNYLVVNEWVAERAIIGTHAYVKYEKLSPEEIYHLIKNALLEINFSYLSSAPPGLLQKIRFIGKRLIIAFKLYRLPESEFPGKTSISR